MAVFYLLPFRAWEPLVGAIICITLKEINGRFQQFLSNLGAIVLIFLMINPFSLSLKLEIFSNPLAVAATSLILLSNPNSGVLTRLLQSRLFQTIGRSSYESYLWHFPLISYSYHLDSDSTFSSSLFLFALTFVLGFITHKFIGNKFRNHTFLPNRQVFAATALAFASILSIFSVNILVHNGYPTRFKSFVYGEVGQTSFYKEVSGRSFPCMPRNIFMSSLEYNGFKRCRQTKPVGRPKIIILGDSTGESLFPGLADLWKSSNIGYYTAPGIPTLENQEYQLIFETILNDPNQHLILLTFHWFGHYPIESEVRWSLSKTLKELRKANKQVVVIGGVPTFQIEAEKCVYRNALGKENPKCKLGLFEYREQETINVTEPRKIAAENKVQFVDIFSSLCVEERCSMLNANKILYRDSLHLNSLGSRVVSEKIVRSVNSMPKEPE